MKDWFDKSIIFLTIHGSQAYGMNTSTSDLDIKGVCIPPLYVREDLFHKFDQAENNEYVYNEYKHLANPNNPKVESTVYSLKKFITLAANVNPNIIELLFVDEEFILESDAVWEMLREKRNLFLSTKARHTFTGYANSQLGKINRHRKWLMLNKVPKQPQRSDFGLMSAEVSKEFNEVSAYIKREIEMWNLSSYGIPSEELNAFKEKIWDLLFHLDQSASIDWDNWPDSYFKAGLVKLQNSIQLSPNILSLIEAEKKYQVALKDYNGYLQWSTERNPARKELELKCGFDSKSGCHLARLLIMGYEIISTGKVIVKRPDYKELLEIRNGGWTYEQVISYADEMQEKIKQAEKTTPLPKSVDFVKINDLYQSLLSYWTD